MPTRTLEFCSLQYLNQWIDHDSKYCDALTHGTEEEKLAALGPAANFYRIARNLPCTGDTEKGLPRYKPLLDVIDSVAPDDFADNTVERIYEVETVISEKYGDKNVLSLTTKILWLKIKTPIIIYDQQARVAIGTRDGDLSGYYAHWRKEFANQSDKIRAVCDKLTAMTNYTTDEKLATPDYIQDLTSRTWFRERVFDIYLWNKGRNP